MHTIEMHSASAGFASCWRAACRHIDRQAQGPLKTWLKVNLNPPFLEHLSFRLGNQLFYVRIEDVDGRLEAPGNPDGLLTIAGECRGHACLMPMRLEAGAWRPDRAGWGLLDARSGRPVDPIALVSEELIEMTEWELQDFAVQIVRTRLEAEGRRLMSWQGSPHVDPSLWFVGDDGPEWVVVRAVRYPARQAEAPANLREIAARCGHMAKRGHFASVAVANAGDAFDPTGATPAMALWRGHGMVVRFEKLVAVRGGTVCPDSGR